MSTFFRQTAQAMIAKHIDRFPLLKLDQVIDWQPIEQYLNRQKTRYLRDHRGRPAYPLLSMFKAVLLGQWHSLSDPELEHSLITRIDFNLFCRFFAQPRLTRFLPSPCRTGKRRYRSTVQLKHPPQPHRRRHTQCRLQLPHCRYRPLCRNRQQTV